MGTFCAGLKAVILAALALDEGALRPSHQVYAQADNAGKHHEGHPQHCTIHSSRLCVSRHPNQQGDVEHEDGDCDERHSTHTGTAGATRSACARIRTGRSSLQVGGVEDRSRQQRTE
jgi:hypothetical protein